VKEHGKSLQELLEKQPFEVLTEEAMQALGVELLKALPSGALVTLSGELGAGKSVLARSMIHATGFEGRVKSPTYTLIETYDVGASVDQQIRISHLDLYRLTDPDEMEYLGFDDVLQTSDLTLIEWPEMGGDRVPAANVHVQIDYAKEDARFVTLTAL